MVAHAHDHLICRACFITVCDSDSMKTPTHCEYCGAATWYRLVDGAPITRRARELLDAAYVVATAKNRRKTRQNQGG